MSREKQIEEMFNDVVEAEQRYHEYCLANICHTCEYYGDGECDNHIRAEYLYNAGYRGQSEGEWYVNYMMSKKPSKRGRIIQYTTYTCSVCGKPNGRKKSKFCPNCGAKMKGGE